MDIYVENINAFNEQIFVFQFILVPKKSTSEPNRKRETFSLELTHVSSSQCGVSDCKIKFLGVTSI